MPFFDFHCHPGLKPQFSDPATKVSPWENIIAKLAIFKNINISINKLFNEVLNSQSNLRQLVQSDVKLFGLILHAPEKKVAVALKEKRIVNLGQINLINPDQLNYLASGIHSFELINTELKSLKDASTKSGMRGASFKIISKAGDFNEGADKTIHGVIIVEGLHCFFDDPDAPDAKERWTANFEKFTSENAVMAINLCHMQQNPFCNHAHGIQLFNPGYFFPTRRSITKWGIEVIDSMISKKILIDIKHMSLLARIDYYQKLRDPNDSNSFSYPIICTHAGTTGLRVSERAKFLLQPPNDQGSVYEVVWMKPKSRHDEETYHNCSSINLYDEDIENIFLSGGIVGFSFDKRILGFADENVIPGLTVPHDVEYISHEESDFFLGPNPTTLPLWTDDEAVWKAEDMDNLDPALFEDVHRRFLINNIIHVLWVANRNKAIDLKKAAKQICIGTDFDGLINAIDCCKQCTGLDKLKSDMQQGVESLLKKEGLALKAADLLDDIFYNNGKNFMLKRLKG